MDVVCCLTSHPARIGNCCGVLKSLVGGNKPPSAICFTLARDKFPNGMDSLPMPLVELLDAEPTICLNWIDFDVGMWSQVLPALHLIGEDELILCCDDDILYPPKYVASRLRDFRAGGGEPLTGCSSQAIRTLHQAWGIPSSIGHACAFMKRHIRGIERFLDNEVMRTNNSDGVYSVVEWLNGFCARDVSEYGMEWLGECCQFNEVDPSRLGGKYLKGDGLLKVLEGRVLDLVGKDMSDPMAVFGAFQSPKR